MANLLDISIDDRVPQTLQALLSPEMLERILDIVAAGARNEWIRLARRELHSSKEAYLSGIQPVEASARVRIIGLVGWFPNAVETGAEPFDMRETLLGPGSKVRKKAADGGWYARIPFRHGTPSSAGRAGTPMGSSYGPVGGTSRRAGGLMGTSEARALGDAVYGAAKRLRATTVRSGMKTQWGERLPAGLAPLLRGPNPAHPDPRMRAGHKTDIYAGMVRERHTYEKATQSQYMTFRTISTKVTNGWIHPGIEAHHLADKVGAYIGRILPAVIGQVFEGALKNGPPAGSQQTPAPGGGGPGSATPWGLIR